MDDEVVVMDVRDSRALKTNGILYFALALAAVSTDCAPKEPTPAFSFFISLIEPPKRLTVTIAPLIAQQAQTNSYFHFNLMPFIELSQPELSYQIYNASRDINYETTNLVGTL